LLKKIIIGDIEAYPRSKAHGFNYLGQDMAVKDIPLEVGWFPFGRYVIFLGETGCFVSFYDNVSS